MSSITTIVKLPRLQALAARGYDLAVLAAIEDAALSQALDMRESKAMTQHPAQEVRSLADSIVPSGAHLDQLYVETLSSLRTKPLRTLQRIADHLGAAAAALEQTAARSASRPVTLGQFARIQGGIGRRYAQLIEAAQTLERAGVVPVHLQGRLSQITDRPEGPLRPFYDKALAFVAARAHENNPTRERYRVA